MFERYFLLHVATAHKVENISVYTILLFASYGNNSKLKAFQCFVADGKNGHDGGVSALFLAAAKAKMFSVLFFQMVTEFKMLQLFSCR